MSFRYGSEDDTVLTETENPHVNMAFCYKVILFTCENNNIQRDLHTIIGCI